MVGLGNPGEEYAATRHNVGFRIVDRFVADLRLPAFSRRRGGLETAGSVGGQPVTVLKPLSFMNRSGGVVARRLAELELGAERLLVCYDELALPLGRLRVRPRGSAAGHNGVQSVIDALGTDTFPRLRFGIGPGGFSDQVRFVLAPFRKAELAVVEEALERAARAVECFCVEGVEAAMNRFNRSSPD